MRCILLSGLLTTAMASEFLGVISPEARRAVLLKELQESLKGGRRSLPTEERVARLEDALRSTFVALPKVQSGTIGAASARYALHRLFLQLHGWQIKGLETAGEAWNELSLDDNVGRLMPERLRDVFDDRLAQGVNLHELALLATTIEHLIHGESEARLAAIYAALELPMVGETLSQRSADEAVDAYMMTFLRGVAVKNITRPFIAQLTRKMTRLYKSWGDTQVFLRDVRESVLPGKTADFSFEDVEAVVEEVGERYGRWQNFECTDLKRHLVELEDREGSGRVRLADFYASTLNNGTYFLKETIVFLRELGALDEASPANPRVIIPNYVLAPSNCLAPMTYYSVCCVNECEEMLGELERQLGAPSASPAKIVQLLSSPATGATLSAELLDRLNDVANFHGGMIPLHGRLLAQWMHHAFPRECAFPHVAGSTRPRLSKEYKHQTGLNATLTGAQLRQYVEEASAARVSGEAEALPTSAAPEAALPWVTEEELVDPKAHRQGGRLRSVLRVAAQALALLAVGATTLGLVTSLAQSQHDGVKKPWGPKVHDV